MDTTPVNIVSKSEAKWRVKRDAPYKYLYSLQRKVFFCWLTVDMFSADNMEHAVHLAKIAIKPPIVYLK